MTDTDSNSNNVTTTVNTEDSLYSQANQYLAKQTKPVIAPSFAKWFEMDSIHKIEKNSLPEFFNNQSRFKSPEIYKDFRNFMVNTYRLNPMEYLSVTAVRRNLAADVASIMRIYGFLSKWGLINYQIDPKTKSFSLVPQFTGHYQITLDKPMAFQFKLPQETEEEEASEETNEETNEEINEETSEETNEIEDDIDIKDENDDEHISKKLKVNNDSIPLNLQLRKNVYNSMDDAFIFNDNKSLNPTKHLYCNITGNDITESRYHNLKNKSNISVDCFENAQFQNFFKNSDFIKLNKINLNDEFKPWNNNEILLLFEAIEMYADDWNLICGHVGSRTKDQCIIKFIQLPLEDKYLEKQLDKNIYYKYLKNLKNSKEVNLNEIIKQNKDNHVSNDINIKNNLNGELSLQDNLITSILKLSLKKFELKLKQFENLEKIFNDEKKLLIKEKESLLINKLLIKNQAMEVRNKLIKASQLGATDEGLRLVEEALLEANKLPKVEVKKNKDDQKDELVQIENNKNINIEDNNTDITPVSVVNPQVYKMWSV